MVDWFTQFAQVNCLLIRNCETASFSTIWTQDCEITWANVKFEAAILFELLTILNEYFDRAVDIFDNG